VRRQAGPPHYGNLCFAATFLLTGAAQRLLDAARLRILAAATRRRSRTHNANATGFLATSQSRAAQPRRPIALFAPRQVGRTFFLDHDLTPTGAKAGLLPVCADVWLHRAATLEAINHAIEEAIEEAIDDATVPKGKIARVAKTPVRKIGAIGASLEVGEPPQRRALPEAPELRLDALVSRLAGLSGKPLLLMLDEIHTLGEVAGGEKIIASLRAVLHERRKEVAAVFTGSSQESMVRVMASAGGPMYQFAQLLTFPVLGDEYLREIIGHFARVHRGRKPELDGLRQVLERIGFKPALMKDLVKSISAEGITDTALALKHFMADERHVTGWYGLLCAFEPFDRPVQWMIAQAHPPLGRETLAELARPCEAPPTVAKVRAAIERLKRGGILANPSAGGRVIEDRLFQDFLAGLRIEQPD
jgi:hypothetical protein